MNDLVSARDQYAHRVETLLNTVRNTGYSSYDPFDALNSPSIFRWVKSRPLAGRIAIQVFKLSPVNFRSLAGTPMIQNDAKVLADLILSCINLYEMGKERPEYLSEAESYAQVLLAQGEGPGGRYSWGLRFPYYSRSVTSHDARNLFTTVNAAYALARLYESTGNILYREVLHGVNRFLFEDLGFVGLSDGTGYVRYYANSTVPTFNVNSLLLKYMTHYVRATGDKGYHEVMIPIRELLLKHQRDDGSWFYDPSASGRWIDGFHTGYVIEGLLVAQEDFPSERSDCCIRRGAEYYLQRLFRDNFPLFTPTSRYPIDSQNCAQALQTRVHLSQAGLDDRASVIAMARKVDDKLFCNDKGYYYYQRWGPFANKMFYLRWGQSPMLLALTYLLKDLHNHPVGK